MTIDAARAQITADIVGPARQLAGDAKRAAAECPRVQRQARTVLDGASGGVPGDVDQHLERARAELGVAAARFETAIRMAEEYMRRLQVAASAQSSRSNPR